MNRIADVTLPPLPSFADVLDARDRLHDVAIQTPLVESVVLNDRVGGRVLLKCESLQRTGSFKFRGAYTAISRLDADTRAKGVVACSSGNHAQGVASAAELFGVPATIVMPEDAPKVKIAGTRGYGADVRLYKRDGEDRVAIAKSIAADTGSSFISPFDHPDTISGQGTCGLEIADALAARDLVPDAVLICCSGGGLAAGIGLVMAERFPNAPLYTVEPADFDDFKRSLNAGHRLAVEGTPSSICDALLVREPGELTFTLNQHLGFGGLSVTDDEVRAAVRFAFETLKLVVEPGGAVALAAVLTGKIDTKGKTIVATLSGGNVDRETFCEIVTDVD
ncbi:MAG: threonine/serine dehydratase [Pseudomonadota bacterium]